MGQEKDKHKTEHGVEFEIAMITHINKALTSTTVINETQNTILNYIMMTNSVSQFSAIASNMRHAFRNRQGEQQAKVTIAIDVKQIIMLIHN